MSNTRPAGPLDGLTWGNGATLALAHDLDGRITAIDALDGASPVLDLDYALYDLAGNIRTITDAAPCLRQTRAAHFLHARRPRHPQTYRAPHPPSAGRRG